MRLYELTNELRRVQDLADDEGFDATTGEYESPGDETQALLDAIGGDFAAKIDGIARVLRNIEAERDAIKVEQSRLGAKLASRTAAVARLKEYARTAMDAVGRPKIKTPLFSVWVQQSAPPLVIDTDATVPESYLRPAKEREPDKTALKAAIKAGVEIVGVRLGVGKRSLRVK